MGRLAAPTRPPASGTIIFYGRPTATSNVTPISKTKRHLSADSDLETSLTPDGVRSLLSIDSNTSSSTLVDDKEITSDEVIKAQHTAGSRGGIDVFSSQIIQPSNPDRLLDEGKHSLILGLVKDVLQAFQEVPYVKIVAGLVQQIVTISNVRSSLDHTIFHVLIFRLEIGNPSQQRKKWWTCPESCNIRSSDLRIVVSFSTPAHKWLLGSEGRSVANCKVCSSFTFYKDYFELMISVLQSIYDIMQFLTTSRANSRLNRLIYRGDIAQKIAEQDRRLDTTITAFQVRRIYDLFKLYCPNFLYKAKVLHCPPKRVWEIRGFKKKSVSNRCWLHASL